MYSGVILIDYVEISRYISHSYSFLWIERRKYKGFGVFWKVMFASYTMNLCTEYKRVFICNLSMVVSNPNRIIDHTGLMCHIFNENVDGPSNEHIETQFFSFLTPCQHDKTLLYYVFIILSYCNAIEPLVQHENSSRLSIAPIEFPVPILLYVEEDCDSNFYDFEKCARKKWRESKNKIRNLLSNSSVTLDSIIVL